MRDPAVACGELGFDPAQPIHSESIALFVASDDGQSAVSLRLCRYPDAHRSWLWVHVFTPQGSFGYNEDHLAPDVAVSFDRDDVDVSVPAHEGATAYASPDAPGPVPVRLTGSFRRSAGAGATLPGRNEELGQATVTVCAGNAPPLSVSGRAHYHEQVQAAPRFMVPFTYASLRGPELSLVALVGPRNSGGFARGVAGDHLFSSASFGDVNDGGFAFEMLDESGAVHRGVATVTHAYTIPIYGRPWSGSIVRATVDGHAVSGSVNRWRHSL